MKLVNEDKYGAYKGIRKAFFKKFSVKEINPNFDVFDSRDELKRIIIVKACRIPDDEEITSGKYGIDYNRPKPTLDDAVRYYATLPEGYQTNNDISFAAANEAEYYLKTSSWDKFYSYIWGEKPQTIWVVPHSGVVNRPPDDILPFPKLWTDTSTSQVATLCAYKEKIHISKRIMVWIHASGLIGAVINTGDFGILDNSKMDEAAVQVQNKYSQQVQDLAGAYVKDYCSKSLKILEHISKRRGTLNPEKLKSISKDDCWDVIQNQNVLKFHGQEIKEFTESEFKVAFNRLGKIEIPVVSNNHPYSARRVSELLKIREHINQGLMDSALNFECAKLYANRDPELVANIILDYKHELFSE
jgi:hypothetical protein